MTGGGNREVNIEKPREVRIATKKSELDRERIRQIGKGRITRTGLERRRVKESKQEAHGLDALLENLATDQSSRQIRADFPTCHIWA